MQQPTLGEKHEFRRMARAMAPVRSLIERAAREMVEHARQAPDIGTPAPPIGVIALLIEAIATMAAVSGLARPKCVEHVRHEFLIRLALRLDELDADGVAELMASVSRSLDFTLVLQ
jgi:hypothetical protein